MTPGRWSDLSRPPLDAKALNLALTTTATRPTSPTPWRSIEVIAETDSTNADLRPRATAGEPGGLVLVAEHQRAGRGRLGRTWHTPPRAALTFSALLRPPVPAQHWGWFPLLAGLAVSDALTTTAGVPARLKWPNDVLISEVGAPDHHAPTEQKVCGILAESVPGPDEPAVIIGIGLNVSQRADELPVSSATSLAAAGAASTDRQVILTAVLRALGERYQTFADTGGDIRAGGLAAAYRERCATIGRQVELHLPGDRVLTGLADGVDDDGRLLIREPGTGAVTAYAAGDVVHARAAPHPGQA